jgi:hypothetical protein
MQEENLEPEFIEEEEMEQQANEETPYQDEDFSGASDELGYANDR